MSSVSDIVVEYECPLGMPACERVVEGKIRRCVWYMSVKGQDPQTGKEIDDWACAMVWQVVVGLEGNQFTRGVREGVTSFRNEVVKGNNQFLGMLGAAKRLGNDPDR